MNLPEFIKTALLQHGFVEERAEERFRYTVGGLLIEVLEHNDAMYVEYVADPRGEINGCYTPQTFKYYSTRAVLDKVKQIISEYDDILHLDEQIRLRVNMIESLKPKDNWDGYGGVAPSKEVVKNLRKLIEIIRSERLDVYQKLRHDEIVPSTYGTVCLEWDYEEEGVGFMQIEVGQSTFSGFGESVEGLEADCHKVSLKEIDLAVSQISKLSQCIGL